MWTSIVVTIAGTDRPGIVDRLSTVVGEHQANWEESRMERLAGIFAGILRVSVAPERVGALEAALVGLTGEGLRISVSKSPTDVDTNSPSRHLRMALTGTDRDGIMRDISQSLAAVRVNIEELHTVTSAAPMGGGYVFHAHAVLKCPSDVTMDALQTTLERLADDLVIDISLEAHEPN